MVNLPWASPEAIGKLTLRQFSAICSEVPPGTGMANKSVDQFQAAIQRREAEAQAWDAPN